MVYQPANEVEHGQTETSCKLFKFDAGNSIQPKTNYCASCAVHKQAICAKLSGAELEAFSSNSNRHVFKPGQTIFNECEDALTIYTVVSGDIRLSRMLDDGRRQITAFKSKGEFIGLSSSGQYTCDAEAINDVVVCQFAAHSLEKSLEEFNALQTQLIEMMQVEMLGLQDHMVVLGRKTPLEKIAHFLVERARKEWGLEWDEVDGVIEVSLPMTRADIADFLGLTIETVSRTITRLRKQGVIELKTAQDVLICDPLQLSLISETAK